MSNPATNWEDAYRVQTERIAELWRENAELRAHAERVGEANDRLAVENAALREDKERMDWLENARPIAWALESVNCRKYWLLTDIGERHPEEAEEFATLRAAIDAARKEAQP